MVKKAIYKRIVIPVDGSKAANLALKHAISLCKNQEATLRIVHCLDYVKLSVGIDGVDSATLQKSLKKDAEKILQKASVLAVKNKVKLVAHLIESYKITNRIDTSIIKDAKNWRADLIILGATKHLSLKHLIFGSEVEHIVHKSDIPILLIRSKK